MIIGLTGAAGSGKDTIADILFRSGQRAEIDRAFISETDKSLIRDWRRIAFADALYQEASEAFEVDVEDLRCRARKETPTSSLSMTGCTDRVFVEVVRAIEWNHFDWFAPYSPRQILQWWGTDYRRAQREDYWLSKVRDRIASVPDNHWVVTDIRFQNEANLVRELGGCLVVVHRPAIYPVTEHVSEAFWRTCKADWQIENNGTLNDLIYAAYDLVIQIENSRLPESRTNNAAEHP